jgi:RNA polymerase sigma-70 factor, ECF subfamily
MTNPSTIFETLQKPLYTFIHSRIENEWDAQDILQEVYLRVHYKLSELKDKSKLESWIYQITRNAIIDYYRDRSRTQTQLISLSMAELEVATEEPPLTALQRLSTPLRKMAEALAEPYREALILTEFEGLSQVLLAKRLGLSVSGAKSRVQRARSMLKKTLQQCCHFKFDTRQVMVGFYPKSDNSLCSDC